MDLVRLRVAQIQRCTVGISHHTLKVRSRDESSLPPEELEAWPVAVPIDSKEYVALALAEILGRPAPEKSALLPHVLQRAQQFLTQREIIEIVVAVEAMLEWREMHA